MEMNQSLDKGQHNEKRTDQQTNGHSLSTDHKNQTKTNDVRPDSEPMAHIKKPTDNGQYVNVSITPKTNEAQNNEFSTSDKPPKPSPRQSRA